MATQYLPYIFPAVVIAIAGILLACYCYAKKRLSNMLSEPANSPSVYVIPFSVREQEFENALLTHPYSFPPSYDSLDLDPPPPYCQNDPHLELYTQRFAFASGLQPLAPPVPHPPFPPTHTPSSTLQSEPSFPSPGAPDLTMERGVLHSNAGQEAVLCCGSQTQDTESAYCRMNLSSGSAMKWTEDAQNDSLIAASLPEAQY